MPAINRDEMFKIGRMILEKYAPVADNTIFGKTSMWTFHVRMIDQSTLGYCDFAKREIVLSEVLVNHGTKEEIVDTLLHELAHAFAGLERTNKRWMGHGKLWKSWARKLGCDDNAKCEMSPVLSKAYKEAYPEKYKKSKYYIIKKENDGYVPRGSCNRRLKNLSTRGYRNDPDSIGNLWLIRTEDWDMAGGDLRIIESKKFR